ncbi:anthocyanidin 3-O-glucoside 2'''-O-xylosyltransferase-like [Lycium ferocissimum]|uniref:anthocyanidin 3-O-glucoside 2'''-O-xylosyltransferase-like n=1 Tax=Lycium ferocissimum TaxID=112874 RepID=UPI002814FC33|nr:anthocyanidin 3-O-glucoside 2'''-O-xylosyltransferase-like [Lycium ferocissimum]
MSENKKKKLHITMFPWFALGHINPFLHLSNELAKRGHQISFLLPKKAQIQVENTNFHPNLIKFHSLKIPHVDGLPLGTETASEVPMFLTSHLATALDQTLDQIKILLSNLKPDIVFYDFAYWVPDIASEIGFKTVCYNAVSAASIAIALVPARKSCTIEEMMKPPKGYPPSEVVLRGHEARGLFTVFQEYGSGVTFFERVTTSLARCDAISIWTCRELEGPFCDYLSSQYNKPVFLTGPILPEPSSQDRLDEKWANWLQQFRPRSVLFCALGSQLVLEKGQFQELVLGIESTNLPFLITVKPPLGVKTVEEALPEGFEERTKGKGIVCGEFVQQIGILNHSSIGCFVSHGGFGSMWESLMNECQIVLVPQSCDHILHTRLLANELKVAVEVERDENGWFTKENLCKTIRSVMDEGSELGELIKKNHVKWKETLTRPGFMSGYIEEFMNNLHEL